MNKNRRFMARRGLGFTIPLSIFVCFAWMLGFVVLDFSLKLSVSVAVFSVIVLLTAPLMNATALMMKPLKELDNNCDPYPMLSEAEEQLTYKHLSESYRFTVLMNNCLALGSVGKQKDAVYFMEQVDIEAVKGINKSVKFIYYNNLACYSFDIGDKEKGCYYLEIIRNMRDTEKNLKVKEIFSTYITSCEAMLAYCNEDYAKAYELVCTLKEPTNRIKVCNAMMRGKILLGLGRIDEAKKELQYVSQNGNKLHIAKEAAEMLAKME